MEEEIHVARGVGPGSLGPVPESVWAVRALPPPYRSPRPWTWVGPEELPRASGVLFELRFGGCETSRSPSRLAEFLSSFRRAYPGVPIVFVLAPSQTVPDPPARLDGLLTLPFVRAVFTERFDRIAYRNAVTAFAPAGLDMWLNTLFMPLTVSQVGAVTCVVRLFSSQPTETVNDTKSLLRELRGMGLPGCKRWKMLAKALPVVLAIQRSGMTVAEGGRLGGYPEEAAFRRHCRVLFGLPPTTLRGYAGWEPLLARFIEITKLSGHNRTDMGDFALSVERRV